MVWLANRFWPKATKIVLIAFSLKNLHGWLSQHCQEAQIGHKECANKEAFNCKTDNCKCYNVYKGKGCGCQLGLHEFSVHETCGYRKEFTYGIVYNKS